MGRSINSSLSTRSTTSSSCSVAMDNTVLLCALIGLISVLYFSHKRSNKALPHIPAVGPSAPVLSYLGAINFFRNAQGVIQEGYNKYKGSVFKIATFEQWVVVVTGPKLIDELRSLPDDQASFGEAVNEMLHSEYTIGRDVSEDAYHIGVVRGQLTRNLSALLPDVIDEVGMAFEEHIPVNDEGWLEVSAFSVMTQIVARASSRIFVGVPKCRDRDFLNLAIDFTTDVIMGEVIIGFFPTVLQPIAGRLFSRLGSSTRRATAHLRPIIDERRKKLAEYGEDWSDKPNDLLMWLMDEARSGGRPDESVIPRVLVVCFAAIHTSSNSFTHALYHLAANPAYVQPLREEIESVSKAHGWDKTSVDKMWLLDSFLKESQRMNGTECTALHRKVLRDVTLSDGTFIPAGTRMVAASMSTHLDEEYYANPNVFDPFRFCKMRAAEGEATKHQYVSTSPEYIPFGHGRHACPGRFFAANELKVTLAYVALNYDVKFEHEGERPKNVWISTTVLPAPNAKVMFRKRQSVLA
ncbi:Ent-kaurene oxidase [Sparassis crispa]|uniref:Ent-kaurene oxidase n=1 Tax=Sparassis crispa TaxID=139825 RepID=A0A401H628_9APHY|nr:Ent-kaurene oxidase [Sparassis crispa]GBE89843.1 Ent-kaurene oxidase [Sparassis crispa]